MYKFTTSVMFKKIDIWVLYLTILTGFLFSIFFGWLVYQEFQANQRIDDHQRFPFLSKTAVFLVEIPVNLKRVLRGPSGDLLVEDRFPTLDGFDGTHKFEESYLLLSRYDGDLQEGVVELVDLRSFKVLHTWNPDIDAFNSMVKQIDEFKYLNRDVNNARSLHLHPKLTKDGGLLFGWGSPLRKIDACSNLVFQNAKDAFHHSIETDLDGNIWVPSYIYPQSLPIETVGRSIREESGFYDDAIVKLSPDGKILFEISVSKIFIDNGLEYLLFSVGDRYFDKDPIHLNDIQPVDFDGEYWKKGDVFLSLRHQSMVLLYRPSTNEIIWKGTGPFFHQHDVDILDEHRISVFNNDAKDFYIGEIVDGHNEVIIYDFKTNEYSSYLKESLIENDVRTDTLGVSQILPNGDLFIEESNYGRTLYFNQDGSLRWAHVNRADNRNVYFVGWSRILYTQEDIQTVNNFLNNGEKCNE